MTLYTLASICISSILFSFLVVLARHQYPSSLYCSLYTSYITNMENLFINQGLPFPFFSWLYWYIEKWYCKEILDAGHSPFTTKISLVILHTICHTLLILLVLRIYYWIMWWSPNWYFSIFSSLVCLILYW